MTLLKPVHKTSVLIPYEQLFIQTYHHNGRLIVEQGTGEQNPLFQLQENINKEIKSLYIKKYFLLFGVQSINLLAPEFYI
jgi:hypothetical protein